MSGSVVKLHAFAPAKIKLSLKLVGKRADGYHLLDSIFVPFRALFDELTLELSDGEPSVTISSNLSEMTDAESNLCSKAAKLYFETTDIHPSCHIHLEKNIYQN
jgi:4-diphosphocytidyl-2-C-methyl-D-erythritol kinase